MGLNESIYTIIGAYTMSQTLPEEYIKWVKTKETSDYESIAERAKVPEMSAFLEILIEWGDHLEDLSMSIGPNPLDGRLAHAMIGMGTELGEIKDVYKVHVFHGHDLDLVNLKQELGDFAFYLGLAMASDQKSMCEWDLRKLRHLFHALKTTIDLFDFDLKDVLAANQRKCNKRYKAGLTLEESQNRNLEAERREAAGPEGKV